MAKILSVAVKEQDWQKFMGPERQDYYTALNEIKYSKKNRASVTSALVDRLNKMVSGLKQAFGGK